MQRDSLMAVAAGTATLAVLLGAAVWVSTVLPPPERMPGPVRTAALTLALALVAELPAGWVAGRLAPSRPLVHALAVAVLGAILGGAALSRIGVGGFAGGFFLNTLHAPGLLLGASLATRGRGRRPVPAQSGPTSHAR